MATAYNKLFDAASRVPAPDDMRSGVRMFHLPIEAEIVPEVIANRLPAPSDHGVGRFTLHILQMRQLPEYHKPGDLQYRGKVAIKRSDLIRTDYGYNNRQWSTIYGITDILGDESETMSGDRIIHGCDITHKLADLNEEMSGNRHLDPAAVLDHITTYNTRPIRETWRDLYDPNLAALPPDVDPGELATVIDLVEHFATPAGASA